MARKINSDTDRAILCDIASGMYTNREIAKSYGVSPSYISKVKNGHKKVSVRDDVSPKVLSDDDYIKIATVIAQDINMDLSYNKSLIKQNIAYYVKQIKINIDMLKKLEEE